MVIWRRPRKSESPQGMANPTQSRPESPPATLPPPEQLLSSLLEPLRLEIDRVLEQLPDTRLEARRVITREWGLDPTPKELRAIVQVAHEPAGQGSLRDTVRSTLALRILVDRELRQLFDPGQIESARLGGSRRACPCCCAPWKRCRTRSARLPRPPTRLSGNSCSRWAAR